MAPAHGPPRQVVVVVVTVLFHALITGYR